MGTNGNRIRIRHARQVRSVWAIAVDPGQPDEKLIPYNGLEFPLEEFSDVVMEFVCENGRVTALKQRDPSGEFVFTRK